MKDRVLIFCFIIFACGGSSVSVSQDSVVDIIDSSPQEEVLVETLEEETGFDIGKEEIGSDVTDSCDKSEIDPLISEGKKWLEVAEPLLALELFDKAIKVCPQDTDAIFGSALAEMVFGAEMSVAAISVVKQASGHLLVEKPDDGMSQNEYLAKEFHNIFMEIRSRFVNGVDKLIKIEGVPLSFDVKQVPVHIGIKPSIVYHGRFDEGDVLLMVAIGNMIIGVLDFIAGQDLNTDMLSLVDLVKDAVNANKKIDFKILSGVLAYLLNQDPRFLNLHEKDGKTLFFDSRVRFSSVGPQLSKALDKIEALGKKEDDVTWVEKQGGMRILKVRNGVKVLPDGTLEEYPLTFEFDPQLHMALLSVSASIKTPGNMVTLHGGIIPITALILSFTSKVGFLDAIGLSIPIDISQLQVPEISGLFQTLIPNLMAFDWGEFFTNPVGLRVFMPEVTKDKQALNDTFVMEWECPSDIQPDGFPSGKLRLLCKEGTEEDMAHFEDTEYAISKDGVASSLPVMKFKDPTWNNLVFIDLEGKIGQTDTLSYKPANLKMLNTAIALMLKDLLKLLPSSQ